jgi:predicted Fe-S protein YdhL (DUF1289 family)
MASAYGILPDRSFIRRGTSESVMGKEIDLVSPCVSVCTLDPVTRYCQGCLRTSDEIAAWPGLSYDGKIEILGRLQERRRAAGLPDRRNTRRRRARARQSPSE